MRFADSFRAARWVRLINLIFQALLFVSFFAGLNYIALKHTWRFDLSETHRSSLSPETMAYLNQLDQPVRIVVTLTDDTESSALAQVYHDVSALLREYEYATATSQNDQGRITVEYVDVFQNQKRAKDLEIDQNPNTVLLICGGNRTTMLPAEFYQDKKVGKEYTHEAFRGEAVLTAAILNVSAKEKKKIYFLEGHSELKDDVSARGLSQIRDQLRLKNFDPAALNLSQTHKVPDDAALLIIAGQKERYLPFEEEILRKYLQTRAGRLILMVEPWRSTGLENLIFDWGVTVYDKQIFDDDPKAQDENGNLHLNRFLPHPITDVLHANDLPVVFGPALVVSEDLGRARDDGLSVLTLIKTSPTAWGETSYRLNNHVAESTPGEDLRLKDGLGVLTISERLKPANNLPFSIQGGRLAVFGSSDVITNNRLNVGNLNLFLQTVYWCVDSNTQVNIPARPIETFTLPLSREQLEKLRLGLLFIVPGSIALLGFLVYWTRRH